MAKNSFKAPDYQEFQILDESETLIGAVRIKPNAILWKPNGAKGAKPWFGITLKEFFEFAESKKKKQAH